jgi:hypothetical protein
MSADYDVRLAGTLTATISSGSAVSGAVNLSKYRVAAIVMPSGWDTAAITFLASSSPGGPFAPVYDDAGNEVSIPSAAAVAGRVIVDAGVLRKLEALSYVQLRSGTAGTPVNQTASRVIQLLVKS